MYQPCDCTTSSKVAEPDMVWDIGNVTLRLQERNPVQWDTRSVWMTYRVEGLQGRGRCAAPASMHAPL